MLISRSAPKTSVSPVATMNSEDAVVSTPTRSVTIVLPLIGVPCACAWVPSVSSRSASILLGRAAAVPGDRHEPSAGDDHGCCAVASLQVSAILSNGATNTGWSYRWMPPYDESPLPLTVPTYSGTSAWWSQLRIFIDPMMLGTEAPESALLTLVASKLPAFLTP